MGSDIPSGGDAACPQLAQSVSCACQLGCVPWDRYPAHSYASATPVRNSQRVNARVNLSPADWQVEWIEREAQRNRAV